MPDSTDDRQSIERHGRATALLAAARRVQPEATAFLTALVEIETPSDVPESQAAALDLIAGATGDLGMSCRRFRGRRSGGTLIARAPAAPSTPLQLLVGHCDTVWDRGTLATMPVRREGTRLYGPGVFDMKAGLTQMLFALRLLRELNFEPSVRPVILVNSDEEIGTLDTHATLRRLAGIANRVFVLEPSLAPDGRLKTARKGVAQYRVTVHGRAAHAGLNPEDGVSAIDELARLVPQLHALNDESAGVNVNVGTIEGGSRPNVVAPTCTALVDVRVPTHADGVRVADAFGALQLRNDEARIEVELTEGRPPMEFTPGGRRLWEMASEIAGAMEFELGHGRAGGGSDGNITSEFAPTLDGLGAVGDGAHSAHENVDLEYMPERTALLAALLLEPALGASDLATTSAVADH
jgi:glutamate carboxypeptidase